MLSPKEIDTELRGAIERAPRATVWPNENFASILDTADVTVKPDGTTVATYRLTYKLFNERARDLAEVSLPYNSSYQTLEVLRARTIKKNGQVMPVRPEDIRTDSPYSEYLMYDDSKAVGFSMPGIDDDCVIDYAWRVTTKPMLPGHFSEDWTFSQTHPVSLSRMALHVPANKQFASRIYNNDKLKAAVTTAPDGTKTYVWEMRDIPPIEPEPNMPDQEEVQTWLAVTSLTDWQQMAHWYSGLIRPQVVPDASIKQTVERLIAGKKTDEEKARALYDYVANRVRYVGLEFGISAFKPHAAKAVQEKLYGDCKDKATLLITMLKLTGIKAWPVLLHTENRSAIHDHLPSLDSFDHCIAQAEIQGKHYWLDATAEACSFGDVPDGDRGSDALVIQDGGGRFEVIPPYTEQDNTVESVNNVIVRQDRSALMEIEVTMHGAPAQEWRGYARTLTPERRQQMVKQMVPPGGTLKSFAVPDGQDKSGPFVLKLTIEVPRLARKTGNLLLVSTPSVMGSSMRNPYTKETRVWPVVNKESFSTRLQTTFVLPEGYTIEEAPETTKIDGPLTDYSYSVQRGTDGRTITTTSVRTIKSGRIPPTDYSKIGSSTIRWSKPRMTR